MTPELKKQMEEMSDKYADTHYVHGMMNMHGNIVADYAAGFLACSEIFEKKLTKIAAMCGNPDAAAACREILKEISE